MYTKVVVPANGLKVNHNDFVTLHSNRNLNPSVNIPNRVKCHKIVLFSITRTIDSNYKDLSSVCFCCVFIDVVF